MIQLQRILVPTDFSEPSRAALHYGCGLVEQFDAELHLLHVLQNPVALIPEPELVVPPPGDYMQELQTKAEQSLSELLAPQWQHGRTVRFAVRQGPPFLEIVRYAEENAIDLIVLGTHGRSGLAHVLLGSVAEKVVRKALCPVLTVRATVHQLTTP